MAYTSRRIRAEERRLFRKTLFVIGVFSALTLGILYVVIPMTARVLLFFAPTTSQTETSQNILFPPSLDPVPEATNAAYVMVSGYADHETQVRILLNGREFKTVQPGEDGTFSSRVTDLVPGENDITAVQFTKDAESSPSAPARVTYKTALPVIEITKPEESQEFSGETRNISLEGHTDPDATVTVNGRVAIVDREGNFSFPIRLSDGENPINVEAQDTAGNTATVERVIRYNP